MRKNMRRMSSSPTVTRVRLDEFPEAVGAMLVEHAREVHGDEMAALVGPDWERYARLENTGALRIWVAWCRGEAVGYIASVVFPNMHYRDVLECNVDLVYVKPGFRGGKLGRKLLEVVELDARLAGCRRFTCHAAGGTGASAMFMRSGMSSVETIYEKVL